MSPLYILLFIGSTVAVVAWAALALYLSTIQGRRTAARALVAEAMQILKSDLAATLSPAARLDAVRPTLSRSSREMLMYAAADRQTDAEAFDVLASYMVERWSGRLEKDASAHRNARDKWRRITACRILYRMNHPATLWLLARAVDERDSEVADTALSLLGRSQDPRAMDVLFEALIRHRHPASLVAGCIEHSPQTVAPRLKALLEHADPVVRFWAASLLARYPNEPTEFELAALTNDDDPRVRKAALQTLGIVGDELAANCAVRLLGDPVGFVRAHAARALGHLQRSDMADRIAVLLGDHDWWARLAARESLEMMGPEVWPVLMRVQESNDRFVRNGAAEVIQNIGVLDSLIVMEAASDNPAPAKIALLRRIAMAGGVRFSDSLVERAGPHVGPRIRALLETMGLEHVAVQ